MSEEINVCRACKKCRGAGAHEQWTGDCGISIELFPDKKETRTAYSSRSLIEVFEEGRTTSSAISFF